MDTICPDTQQNIMVISTPNEDSAVKYAKIKDICIQGKSSLTGNLARQFYSSYVSPTSPHHTLLKSYEVSTHCKAPHGTVKDPIRGTSNDVNADELDRQQEELASSRRKEGRQHNHRDRGVPGTYSIELCLIRSYPDTVLPLQETDA